MSGPLAGRRVVVVGASSGIGRGVTIEMAGRGADVIGAARRVDLLAELQSDRGSVVPLSLDLRDERSRKRFIDDVRVHFEQIDVLLISAGAAPLQRLQTTSSADWLMALETNVIGVNAIVGGLVDILAPAALTIAISSESVGEPRSHLGAYGASKAALEHTFSQWREEHPWLRFVVVSLGATVPTEFGNGFDHDQLIDALTAWASTGRNQAAFMSTPEVCGFVTDIVGSLLAAPSIDMRSIVLRSPSPPERDVGATIEIAQAQRLQ
jgi:NADP-dependent 3-hydroxy acid dehydrogenase YdfG